MKVFLLAAIALGSIFGNGLAAEKRLREVHAAAFTIFMIGDSTMANKPLTPPKPERGWGQLLPIYFAGTVRIENHAMNGRSARAFITEGRWKTVLEGLKPGDYVIIQFGHNDEKITGRGAGAFGDYKKNLERFVAETRERKAAPILATPIARRRFDEAGKLFDTHGDYPQAVQQVAAEMNVPLLDLHARTLELLKGLGPELSIKLFNHAAPGEYAEHPDGLKDDTHLNSIGATRVCDLAVAEIGRTVPRLAAHLRK
jgi:lysophospholipase L1-like esterase